MTKSKNKHIETIAVHAGRDIEAHTGAVTPSITLATTFLRDAEGNYPSGYSYSRESNPNRVALEQSLAALESGTYGFAFASGQAAISALMQTLDADDHVLLPDDIYYGARQLIVQVLGRWGLKSSEVDMQDLAAVKKAIQPNTKLVWLETPSNPMLKIVDIQAIAEIAHSHDSLVGVDNTWATPILQQPLSLGADVVMHSTTKYIGGHSDILSGCIVLGDTVPDKYVERLSEIQHLGGAVTSPFDAWLLLRSIPTLPYRVRSQSEAANKIAHWLNEHPRVDVVHYPGLEDDMGHNIAIKQMAGGFGGMLSFQIDGDEQQARQVASSTQIITQATSLGGIESLIEHRASVEGPQTLTPSNLLRLSVGLEHVDDLINDLSQALEKI